MIEHREGKNYRKRDLVLANTCGWADKQQVSGDSVNPLSFLLELADGSSKDPVEY